MFAGLMTVTGTIAILSATAPSAFAVSEADFPSLYESTLRPYFDKAGVQGTLSAQDGTQLAYIKFELPPASEKAAVLLISGRGESYEKYVEVVYELTHEGYSVYSMDSRGQGKSQRLAGIKNSEIGYVKDFNDYASDLDQFVHTVVKPETHKRRFILAHSMGGAIATLYLHNGHHGKSDHQAEWDGAILTAPMFEINTGKYSNGLAHLISSAACLFGQCKKYALGQTDWDPSTPFKGNDVTSSEVRYENWESILRANPSLIIGGASFGWVKHALVGSRQARLQATKIKIPLLVLEAGHDDLVKTPGEENFCRIAAQCRLVPFPTAMHEILMEQDSIRTPAMAQIFSFLAN